MDPRLEQLKETWLASAKFEDEQTYLKALTEFAAADYVYLDPDGSAPPWLTVVVRRDTNVVYGTQCAGLACEQRMVEGYLVPVGGWKADVDEGEITLAPFTDVFHVDGACRYGWCGKDLPPADLNRLRRLVREVPFWHSTLGANRPDELKLDETHLSQIVEAWIPVVTPYGRGVLLYKNCD